MRSMQLPLWDTIDVSRDLPPPDPGVHIVSAPSPAHTVIVRIDWHQPVCVHDCVCLCASVCVCVCVYVCTLYVCVALCIK